MLTSDASQTSQPKTQGCSPRLSATVQTAERLPRPCSLQIPLLQTRISRMSAAAKTQRRTARRTPSPQKNTMTNYFCSTCGRLLTHHHELILANPPPPLNRRTKLSSYWMRCRFCAPYPCSRSASTRAGSSDPSRPPRTWHVDPAGTSSSTHESHRITAIHSDQRILELYYTPASRSPWNGPPHDKPSNENKNNLKSAASHRPTMWFAFAQVNR